LRNRATHKRTNADDDGARAQGCCSKYAVAGCCGGRSANAARGTGVADSGLSVSCSRLFYNTSLHPMRTFRGSGCPMDADAARTQTRHRRGPSTDADALQTQARQTRTLHGRRRPTGCRRPTDAGPRETRAPERRGRPRDADARRIQTSHGYEHTVSVYASRLSSRDRGWPWSILVQRDNLDIKKGPCAWLDASSSKVRRMCTVSCTCRRYLLTQVDPSW
jgi:hypothetical protein